MPGVRRSAAIVLLVLTAVPAAAAARRPASAPIARSPLLWATVNVCNTRRYPHTVGLRASMPGDGARRERMRLRLLVQYRSRTDGAWHPVGAGGDSGWIGVGNAAVRAREAGERFRFLAPGDRRAVRMRGAVTFEWRRGSRLVRRLTRLTSGGHRSGAGADPPGHTAATCLLR